MVCRGIRAKGGHGGHEDSGYAAAAAAAESLVPNATDVAFDDAVAARLRRWYLALQAFKKQSDSLEFVYMRNADPDSVNWNPYNIEIVPHAQIKVRIHCLGSS
jgi:hypothetical protein